MPLIPGMPFCPMGPMKPVQEEGNQVSLLSWMFHFKDAQLTKCFRKTNLFPQGDRVVLVAL